MKPRPTRCAFFFCWLLALPALAADSTPAPEPAAAATEPPGNFELLPRSFQRNPALGLTVITEMTEAGKKLPPVSPQAPAYYAVQSGGYHVMGEPSHGKSLTAPEVEAVLQRALATGGYLPADQGHPPTLLVVYLWGAHNLFDQDNPALSDEQWTNNILERAALAGGEKFAAELRKAIQHSDDAASASVSHLTRTATAAPEDTGGPPNPTTDPFSNLGAAAAVAQMNAMMDPVRLLKQRSPKNEFLLDQASADCYYVVASAYAYRSVATHVKQLLWRTRMTVNATGVSQLQSLPALIAAAGPYFGKDMAESEILTRRAVPEGKVEIGTPTVVEPAPANGPAGKP